MIDPARLEADLDTLSRFGRTPDGGVNRPAFTPDCAAAERWLAERMHDAGLHTRIDAAGNVIGRLGPDGPAVVVGSHIDSVPAGGRFDGALGVIAGLECGRALGPHAGRLARAVEIVAFADEEGRFVPHLGSRAMAADLDGAEVAERRAPDGARCADAMAAAGLDAGAVAGAARPAGDIAAYLELHIEQGPLLATRNAAIGVVSTICGCTRAEVLFTGASGHSGAVPQALRRDALLAAAEWVHASEHAVLERGHAETRLTFAQAQVSPGIDGVIPGQATVRCEVRGPRPEVLAGAMATVAQLAKEVGARRGVGVSVDEYANVPPVSLDPELCRRVAHHAQALGFSSLSMISGAGHDAQSFAPLAPTALIFVPSEGGLSHRPDEHTSRDHVTAGASVILGVLRELLELEPEGPPAAGCPERTTAR